MNAPTQSEVSPEGAKRPLLWILIGSWLLAASCSSGGDAGDQTPTNSTRWGEFSWGEADWS